MAILSVPIMLDKQRNLKFGYKSMLLLEDLYKPKGFIEIINGLQSNPKISMVKDIFWAGLVQDDPNLTSDQVIDMLDNITLDEILEKITEAVEGALNEKNSEAAEGKTEKPTAE